MGIFDAEFDLRSLKIRKFYHKLNMIFIKTGVKMRVPNCKKTHEKLNLIIWYLIIFWSGNTLGQVDIVLIVELDMPNIN